MSLSRIGKLPIPLPAGVTADVQPAQITVKGPKGDLVTALLPAVKVSLQDNVLVLEPKDDTADTKAKHGLMRALVANMVTGVSEGFEKQLEIHGVGYRANVAGRTLKMSLGYSHEINFDVPEGIEVSMQDSTIVVKGINKQLVGQTAARIRAYRKPEPYKGKGIRYSGEYIIRKSGKTAA
jgi:large subunit ribosomal protein L6